MLPKQVGEHAGACEVYTSAHRETATRLGVPLGLGAGVFGSLVGVGGGVLIVPAMTATVPIPQRVITGTSLVAVLATASVSTVNFAQGGQIDFAAAVVGAAAMVFAPLGARATAALDGVALKRALATFLLCAAPLVPLKALAFAKRGRRAPRKRHFSRSVPTARRSTRRAGARRHSPRSARAPASRPGCWASAAARS